MAEVSLPWIDLESTGLDPHEEVILEIGIALTDRWGTLIDSNSWVIYEPHYDGIIENAIPYVKEMHKKSGLWDEVLSGNARDLGYTSASILNWLDDYSVKHGELPMCGSSVGFDRGFLATHLPMLHDNFHYRNVDVSTVKELCRRLNPELFAKLPEKRELHRALPDLDETLAEYRFYLDNFLFTEREEVPF